MKTSCSALAILFASSVPFSTADDGLSLDQCFPGDIPWYTYKGNDYIFMRMKYNSICVDNNGEQYQWGKIEGVWPPIDEPNSGCAKACVSGYGRGEARGCTSMKPNKLVGYNYNCDEAACYCLYEKNTWHGDDSPCFDSMDTSNIGQGEVYNSAVQPGSTCYSLHVQAAPVPTPAPFTPFPTEPSAPAPGSSICTYAPDYDCYKTGRPPCCDVNDGEDCPDFLTMCDNIPENWVGWSYCTQGRDYDCYSNGKPTCCDAPGGDLMNCPIDQPPCDKKVEDTVAAAARKFLRA